MKCLTEEQIDELQMFARRATVRLVADILRRRAEAATTYAVERALLRAADEVEAMLSNKGCSA